MDTGVYWEQGQKMHRKGIRGVLETHPRGEQMGMFGKDDFFFWFSAGGKAKYSWYWGEVSS